MKSCPHCIEHKETNLAEQLLGMAKENNEYKEFLDNILEILQIKEVDNGAP